MNYLDVYFSRINHLGETTAERIKGGGERSFEKWKDESPHTVRQLSVERGLFFDGIILTDKDKESKKIMYLNVSNNIPLLVGDIMNWTVENGVIEKWLLIQEEKKVNGTYRTFWIVRCNYLLKWVDEKGHLQQSWSYFVSSLDSKIKGNYRTWHGLITPQPNKYAEILMPRYPISRATNFIVEEESWTVVEYDHTSVPGVIYLSLTESKINLIYDDVDNNIADTDKIAQYALLLPAEIQHFSVGDIIDPQFTLTKNGVPINEPYELISTDKKKAKMIDDGTGVKHLTAMQSGDLDVIVKLINYPTIQNTLSIIIDAAEVFSAYIEGEDKLRLDRINNYKLVGTEEITGSVIYTLDATNLAKIVTTDENGCQILANNRDMLGEITLRAEYDGISYVKTISIIPLW